MKQYLKMNHKLSLPRLLLEAYSQRYIKRHVDASKLIQHYPLGKLLFRVSTNCPSEERLTRDTTLNWKGTQRWRCKLKNRREETLGMQRGYNFYEDFQ